MYKEKLSDIDIDIIRSWVEELCQEGKIVKINSTGSKELDGKWFTPYMAEIHGTLGCLATNGGKEVKDLRELHTDDLEYESHDYDTKPKT